MSDFYGRYDDRVRDTAKKVKASISKRIAYVVFGVVVLYGLYAVVSSYLAG